MRRSCFAILLLITIISTGCRQTTGTTATNPLTPIGPLAPIGNSSNTSGNGSFLGPLGAPTRVTPPPPGAFSVRNNYMGGALPIGQAYNGNPSPGGFATSGSGQSNQVIGSGVRSAGWNETGSNVQTAGGAIVPPGTSGLGPSSLSPRLGGMRVIDMTGAPPPPGYFPSVPTQAAPIQPSSPPPQFESNVQPLNQPFSPVPGFRTIQSPSAGDLAGSQNIPSNTLQSPVTIAQGQPPLNSNFRGSAQFQAGPSTDPVQSGQSGNDLQWRRPASRY